MAKADQERVPRRELLAFTQSFWAATAMWAETAIYEDSPRLSTGCQLDSLSYNYTDLAHLGNICQRGDCESTCCSSASLKAWRIGLAIVGQRWHL